MRAYHPAGLEAIPGQVSLVKIFRGFSSPVRQMSGTLLGPQGPRLSFGRHNHPFIFALLE